MTLEESRAQLDAAVLAYRANPCQATSDALRWEQVRHTDLFYREQTIEFIERTKGA